MKFTLEIELGSEAMQTMGNVMTAFQQSTGNPLDWHCYVLNTTDGRSVKDIYGDLVGKWEVSA